MNKRTKIVMAYLALANCLWIVMFLLYVFILFERTIMLGSRATHDTIVLYWGVIMFWPTALTNDIVGLNLQGLAALPAIAGGWTALGALLAYVHVKAKDMNA